MQAPGPAESGSSSRRGCHASPELFLGCSRAEGAAGAAPPPCRSLRTRQVGLLSHRTGFPTL